MCVALVTRTLFIQKTKKILWLTTYCDWSPLLFDLNIFPATTNNHSSTIPVADPIYQLPLITIVKMKQFNDQRSIALINNVQCVPCITYPSTYSESLCGSGADRQTLTEKSLIKMKSVKCNEQIFSFTN